MTSPTTYLDPTDESVIRLLERRIDGPVTMLNLLRFREWADYSAFPEVAPSEPNLGQRGLRPIHGSHDALPDRDRRVCRVPRRR
jgi:hypothetical protein